VSSPSRERYTYQHSTSLHLPTLGRRNGASHKIQTCASIQGHARIRFPDATAGCARLKDTQQTNVIMSKELS
jgi:hypothetical protein